MGSLGQNTELWIFFLVLLVIILFDIGRSVYKFISRSAEDCDKVVASFLRILERRLSSLSLDDIERFCEHWRKEKSLQFWLLLI